MQGFDLLQEGEFLPKDWLVVFPGNGRITGFLINILNIWGYHNYVCQHGIIKIIFLSCPSLSCSEPVLIGRREGVHNKTPCSALLRMHSQQTFVLMKTFWRCLSSSSSEEILIKTNIIALLIRLQKSSLSRSIYFIYMFYMFSGLPKRIQDVLKTSLQGVSQRCLQDVWSS